MANTSTTYSGPLPIPVTAPPCMLSFGQIGIQGVKPLDPTKVTTGKDNAISTRK